MLIVRTGLHCSLSSLGIEPPGHTVDYGDRNERHCGFESQLVRGDIDHSRSPPAHAPIHVTVRENSIWLISKLKADLCRLPRFQATITSAVSAKW